MAGRVKHIPLSPGSKANRAMAEAEALFLSIGEGAIVIDATGNVSRVNQAALTILGMKAKDLLGKWYPETVVAENEAGEVLSHMERPITEMFITGKSVFRKLYFRRPGAERVAVALTVSPVLVEGQPVGAIEVFRDISEEVRLDKAKDEFIYLASHQLRTPATGVKQYLGLLMEGYAGELPPEQMEFLQVANKSNDRQLRIIDELLKVAAADSGKLQLRKEHVDIVAMLDEVVKEQDAIYKTRKQPVTISTSQPSVLALVDQGTMRMVFENLVSNAHKYSYPAQHITVRIKRAHGYAHVTVKDEGVGIKESDMNGLFQKFSRIDNPLSVSSGGTGLGLYWAKKIIDLHDGTIDVESAEDKGTTFRVRLPLS